jgi:hypothetical protein
MPITLLLSSPEFTWRDWLKDHRGEKNLLCLDPGDPSQTPPGKLTLWKGSKPLRWRFYGSLDPARAPHVLVAALASMLTEAGDDCIVQLFSHRNTPLMRQVTMIASQIVQPAQILAPAGAGLDLEGLPVGPEDVTLEASFPQMVQEAQRKAQWMKLVENCSEHKVELPRVAIEGVRLGSGKRLHPEQLRKIGIECLHAEVSGGSLLVISETEPDENVLSRALDIFHASRAVVHQPRAYQNLVCSFANQAGEDFGFGLIRSIDFASGVANILCTAVAPAPVRILRIGSLRVDPSGKELGETKPWQV